MSLATITYKTDHDASADGTHKITTIKASYDTLVKLFGEPDTNAAAPGEHFRVLWTVEFSDGEVLTVYDWNDDREIYNVDSWNIGAKNFMVGGRIYDILHGRAIYA